ncbi:MAG: hypothetical protein QMD46_11565 [Methanomicrobiales archaeon]|nr:hypothetical protein [Methanomicrobiales archaeon]MDI6877287.1 hypothetical protein [Methanomicrobiales archaeon]
MNVQTERSGAQPGASGRRGPVSSPRENRVADAAFASMAIGLAELPIAPIPGNAAPLAERTRAASPRRDMRDSLESRTGCASASAAVRDTRIAIVRSPHAFRRPIGCAAARDPAPRGGWDPSAGSASLPGGSPGTPRRSRFSGGSVRTDLGSIANVRGEDGAAAVAPIGRCRDAAPGPLAWGEWSGRDHLPCRYRGPPRPAGRPE